MKYHIANCNCELCRIRRPLVEQITSLRTQLEEARGLVKEAYKEGVFDGKRDNNEWEYSDTFKSLTQQEQEADNG